jgi:glycerophosphoryl diester phosphodiesterase
VTRISLLFGLANTGRVDPLVPSPQLQVEAWDAPGEPVSYADAMAAMATEARPFAIGSKWSRPWGTTWFRFTADVPADWAAELEDLGCVSLHTDHETLTREKARAVKHAGYWLFCYTVNDPERAREIFSWGVDALCTDRIDLIGADFV